MAYRDDASDAMRKGAAGTYSVDKDDLGFQYVMPPPQGKWLPAYSSSSAANGGMGRTAMDWDSDQGTAGNEVGNDYDGDYDDRPFPQTS